MKLTLTNTTVIFAFLITTLTSTAGPRGAIKKGLNPHKANPAELARRAATKEEEILYKIDSKAWQKDPEARDYRSENLREYTTHTYKRIVKLLILGAIEEADGNSFKTQHNNIVTTAKAANTDGLDATERQSIRTQLNTLNTEINSAITKAEQGTDRTPLVNRAQHRFEERIKFGIKSGRLSTLEASSLRRKVIKLEKLEERLKAGKDLSSTERERLMEEVLELHRDLTKALRS